MKVLIADDEPLARQRLREQLEKARQQAEALRLA